MAAQTSALPETPDWLATGEWQRARCREFPHQNYLPFDGPRRRRTIPRSRRLLVYLRDGGVCQVCLNRVWMTAPRNHSLAPSLDHIVPHAYGGSDRASNLQLAHRSCNSHRGCSPDPAGGRLS